MIENPRKVQFKWDINLGHVLTAMMLMGSLITMYVSIHSRLTVVEVRVPAIEKALDAVAASQKAQLENQATLTRTLDRLTFLVEELRTPRKP